MSHALHFTGPFVKDFHQIYQSATAYPAGSNFFAFQRHAGNPASNTLTNGYVAAPLRRIYLIIQNTGTTPVDICLNDNGSVNYPSLKVLPNQTVTFESYNGPISATTGTIKALEAFA